MTVWLQVIVVVVALLLSAGLGSGLTAAVLRLAARSGDAGGRYRADDDAPPAPSGARQGRPPSTADEVPPSTVSDGPTGRRARDTLRGGTWIGILERLAITAVMIAGYPAGIALVIAVKGLGRYPELRENPGASERFVIGTLTSMLWAAVLGGVARAVLG